MSSERVTVLGIVGTPVVDLPRRRTTNHDPQSVNCDVGGLGGQIAIIREVTPIFAGMKPDEEIEMRRASVRLFRKYLPDHTLPTTQVVMQGEDLNGEPVTLLGRFSPKLRNVLPITECDIGELARDKNVARSIANINLGYIKMILSTGLVPDVGKYNNVGEPSFWGDILNKLTSENIMIGLRDGKKQVFCDPDWSLDKGAYAERESFERFKFNTLVDCTLRYGFWKVCSLLPEKLTRKITVQNKLQYEE